MRIEAFALLGVFTALSIGAGLLAWRLIVPHSPWGAAIPAVASFLALYLIGHLLDWTIGPTVRLFGFDVALPWEVLLAVVVALAAAGVVRALGDRLGG